MSKASKTSSSYHRLVQGVAENKAKPTAIPLVGVVVLLVSSSFVGLWAHRYAPIHLYDPSIGMSDVGEHKAVYSALRVFLNTHVTHGNVDKVLADDILLLYVILPPSEYAKILRLTAKNLLIPDRSLVLQLRELNLYEYYYSGSPPIKPWEIESQKSDIRLNLETNLNCIYCDGEFKVWDPWRKSVQ